MTTLTLHHAHYKFSIVQKIQAAMAILNRWIERHHQRKQLAQLDVHQLNDLGLNLEQVMVEIDKPFWK